MNDLPLVSISCITYNHASYIKECIDGFLMQKTNFNFEVLIHDDHSIDGTEEIIKEYAKQYPDIIKPLFEKENQYSLGKPIGSVVWNLPRARGKYIAMCEGDDYWIDPYKLQKQVDIMENNPNCSLVISNGISLNEITKKQYIINPMGDIKKSGFISPNLVLLERRLIPTASMFYRKDQSKMPDFFRNCPVGDRPLRLWLLSNGDIYYFANPMIMYREQSNGSFGQRACSSVKYAKEIYDGMIAFYNNYNEFTKYKYNKEIQYLKSQDEYNFYIRTKQIKESMNTMYFKNLPLTIKLKRRIKYWIKTIKIIN